MSSSDAARELLSKRRSMVEEALSRFLPAESGQFMTIAKAMTAMRMRTGQANRSGERRMWFSLERIRLY